MDRTKIKIFLFVACIIAAMSLPAGASGSGLPPVHHHNHVLRSDTLSRMDTVITREVMRRVEVINTIEEIIRVDTIRNGILHKGRPLADPIPVDETTTYIDALPNFVSSTPEAAECSLAIDSVRMESALPVAAEGGKYVWVPDSMTNDVDILLAGHSKFVDDPRSIDTNERVLFRGDTIPMVLRDRNLGRFNRGLFNYLYIPRGIWQLGITASYGEFSTEDLEMFDLISDTDFHGKMFSVKPYFSYFFKNNMSAGLRLGYTYGRANIDSFKVDIDDDMNFNLHDIMYRSESFSAALTFNQYFGITRRGRFAVTNEVELGFAGGNSDFIRPYNSELKHTHTTSMEASLNFSPGLSVYIIEPLTFNISFGVFGFYLKNEKQTVDGEELGNRFTSGANFRFNIFNINFGVAVNL